MMRVGARTVDATQRAAWRRSGQGGARVEEDKDDLHALLERAAKLMVKAGYRAYGPVKIKVAGKEKSYGFIASNVYLKVKRGTPPTEPRLGA
jgi:hypothetical protein